MKSAGGREQGIAEAAGIELEQNHAQMVLMDKENSTLQRKVFAKKQKQSYTTGGSQHMTGTEMQENMLHDLHKKVMQALHKEIRPKFKEIKKAIQADTRVRALAAYGQGHGNQGHTQGEATNGMLVVHFSQDTVN